MGILSASRYLIVLFYLCFYLRINRSEEQNLSFDFENFGKDSNFESQLALYGDAKVVDGGIQMSGSMGFTSGRIINKKPIKLIEKGGNPRKMVSFSMNFVFSLSSENGDGFAFIMVPMGYPFDVFDSSSSFGLLGDRKMKFLAVEFDTFLDEKYGDVNGNHVGVDLNSFVSLKVSNFSLGLMNNGEKIQSWIDYEASSKRLEVRLSKLGSIKPINPLLSCFLDLSRIWKDNELFVGLSSSSGNSTQKCNIYSWGFETRIVQKWMHSEPLDPQEIQKKEEMKKVLHSKSDCVLRILGVLLLGTGCGALGAFVVVIIWTILGGSRRRAVVPEEHNPDVVVVMEHNNKVKEFDEYKKFIQDDVKGKN